MRVVPRLLCVRALGVFVDPHTCGKYEGSTQLIVCVCVFRCLWILTHLGTFGHHPHTLGCYLITPNRSMVDFVACCMYLRSLVSSSENKTPNAQHS